MAEPKAITYEPHLSEVTNTARAAVAAANAWIELAAKLGKLADVALEQIEREKKG